jgi:hypothetical protein
MLNLDFLISRFLNACVSLYVVSFCVCLCLSVSVSNDRTMPKKKIDADKNGLIDMDELWAVIQSVCLCLCLYLARVCAHTQYVSVGIFDEYERSSACRIQKTQNHTRIHTHTHTHTHSLTHTHTLTHTRWRLRNRR